MDTSQWTHQSNNKTSLSRSNSMTYSIKSSLSAIQHTATRYRKYIIFASIFLMISAIILIFCSLALLKWYLMPNLDFWDNQFLIAPYFLLGLGIYKLTIAIYSWTICSLRNRGLLSMLSVLLVIAFASQLVSVVLFWNVRTTIILGQIGGVKVQRTLKNYNIDEHRDITETWDYMQQHLSCCGGNEWQTGYIDYKNTPFGRKINGVPDSCCLNPQPNCGKDLYNQNPREIPNKIYVNGCLGILRKWMERDILPMIWVYTFVSVVVAFFDLIVMVLVCAYIAQISRRYLKKEDNNFINILKHGMYGNNDAHYPKLPDSNFMNLRSGQKRDEISNIDTFLSNQLKMSNYESDRKIAPVAMRQKKGNMHSSRDEIHPKMSEHTHAMKKTDQRPIPAPRHPAIPSNETKIAAYETAQQVSMMKKKTYLHSSKDDNRPKISDHHPTTKTAEQRRIQTPQYAAIPSREMTITTYEAEPKIARSNYKRQRLNAISTPKPIVSSNIETSVRTTKPVNNIANLRRAWIRDNITLEKHPSALEAGSLMNITNPIRSSVAREARSLTPDKNPKPIKVQVSSYNNTTQSTSLETNL